MDKAIPKVLPGILPDARSLRLFNEIANRLPNHWIGMIPKYVPKVSSKIPIVQLSELPRGTCSPGLEYFQAQVFLVNDVIYFHHDELKNITIFTHEVLSVLALSMCLNPAFRNYLDTYVSSGQKVSNVDKFAGGFPRYVFTQGTKENLRRNYPSLHADIKALDVAIKEFHKALLV